MFNKLAQKVRWRLDSLTAEFCPPLNGLFAEHGQPDLSFLPAPARSLAWIRNHETLWGGIISHTRSPHPYPEVTGYTIPTLFRYGETDMARRLLRWLISAQQPDGSYTDHLHGLPYVFDTAQAVRGLLCGLTELPKNELPQIEGAMRRSLDYLHSCMVDEGRGGFKQQYEAFIPETIQLYSLRPIIQAAETLDRPDIAQAGRNCVQAYLKHPALLSPGHLTHFLAYEIDGLLELGETAPALESLNRLKAQWQAERRIVATDHDTWICIPALAQLAVCWYKIGDAETADAILQYFEGFQHVNGGFFGSTGPMASYSTREEITWGPKFHLDAHWLRLQTQAARLREAVAEPALVSCALETSRASVLMANPGGHAVERGTAFEQNIDLPRETPAVTAHFPSTLGKNGQTAQRMLSSARANHYPAWEQEIFLNCGCEGSVLMLDATCGGTAIKLASMGRRVTICAADSAAKRQFDMPPESLPGELAVVPATEPTRLPFADDSFDCVVADDETLARQAASPESLLAECRRVTRSALILFVSDPARLSGLETGLAKAGFAAVSKTAYQVLPDGDPEDGRMPLRVTSDNPPEAGQSHPTLTVLTATTGA